MPDRRRLQVIDGHGTIGYSRLFSPAGNADILEHDKAYGGPEPPPLDHNGIDDAFAGKASVVQFWYNGQWLTLTRAD